MKKDGRFRTSTPLATLHHVGGCLPAERPYRLLPEGHPVRPLQAAKGGPRTVPVSFRESPGPPPLRDAPRGRDGRDGAPVSVRRGGVREG